MSFPKIFTDKKGRVWNVHIGLVANARLREAGIALEEFVPMPSSKMAKAPPDMSELNDLLHGSFSGVRAITAITADQRATANVSEMDFLDAVDDEAIMATMSQALLQAIIDFFQKSPLRQALVMQAWKSGQALMAAAARQMTRAMDRVNTDQMIQRMEEDAGTRIDAEIAAMTKPLEAGKSVAGSTPA